MSEQKKELPLAKLEYQLGSLLTKGLNAIPSDVNTDRLKINALMYIGQDKKLNELAQLNPPRIAQIVYNFIVLGLDMMNKECYIIPFKDELVVIKDYKGEIKLAKKYSVDPIREIYARVVYENDEFYFDELDHFKHKFNPFALDRGKKLGAFCTIVFENGVIQTEFVNLDEIKKVKDFSKSSGTSYSPWNNWEESMFKKTAIRKALKTISLDFKNEIISKAYVQTETDVDFNQPRKPQAESVIQKDAFVDAEFDEKLEQEVGQEVSLKDLE